MRVEGDVNFRSLICKLKRGMRVLSQLNWVSASGFHISVASIVGIAGLVLAIRDGKVRKFNSIPWSSDRDSSLEKWVVPGLQNFGNNCFLNVVLQALASCSCFRSFLEKIVEEFGSLLPEEQVESLPLTCALASLVEELCTLRHGREVLSPWKVMLAMDHYIPYFNLTIQQDAEEAFSHTLSSLREELSELYVSNHSLADVTALPNLRILVSKRRLDQSEQEKWRRIFVGPFDGILGSILTCQSCLFQISLDFQFFHSLHLSPVLSSSATIMAGCSLEDCLRQFFDAEQLENYCCSHCWHIAAIKYLSTIDEDETDIGKLRHCSEQGSCDCKNISSLGALPWSNSFSRTFKQLNIARSPKVLCIHLQRTSVNAFGELVKLQGHIYFPLILNLSPYVKSGVGIKNREEKSPSGLSKQQYQQPPPYSNHLNMQVDTRMLNCIYGKMGKNIYSQAVVAEELKQTAFELSGNSCMQAFQEEPCLSNTGGCSDTKLRRMPMQSDDKLGPTCHVASSEPHMYSLVSVVQHFGRSGSGHYTVYRKMRTKLNDGDLIQPSDSSISHWFHILDSEVYSVSEEEVLATEASVLFYEKILVGENLTNCSC